MLGLQRPPSGRLRQNALGAQRSSEQDVSQLVQSPPLPNSVANEAISALSVSSITATMPSEEAKQAVKRESGASYATRESGQNPGNAQLTGSQSGKWDFFKGLMRPSRDLSRENTSNSSEAKEKAEVTVAKEIPNQFSRMLKISIVGGIANVKAVFNLLNNENSFVLADTLVKV